MVLVDSSVNEDHTTPTLISDLIVKNTNIKSMADLCLIADLSL